jgi:hypothetical protein
VTNIGAGFLLLLIGPQEGSPAGLADLDRLPDDAPPRAYAEHPAVRRAVAAHRSALADLRATLESTASWKVRLGAAKAAQENGFTGLLAAAAEDAHPRLRDLARAALRHPPGADDGASPYSRDPVQRSWTDEALRTPVDLSPEERAARARSVVRDLLLRPEDDEAPEAAWREAARLLAAREAPLLLGTLSEQAALARDAREAAALWTVFGDVALRARGIDLGSFGDAAAPALTHADPSVRAAALIAFLRVATLDRRGPVLDRALEDPDPEVSRSAFLQGVDQLARLQEAGDEAGADRWSLRLDGWVARSPEGEERTSAGRLLERRKAELRKERELLRQGGADGTRYLQVGSRRQAVSPGEFSGAMARFGKPYVTEEQFLELRRGRRDEQRAKDAEVPPLPPARTAPPEGDPAVPGAPPDRSGRPASSRGLWALLFGAGVLVILVRAFARRTP